MGKQTRLGQTSGEPSSVAMSATHDRAFGGFSGTSRDSPACLLVGREIISTAHTAGATRQVKEKSSMRFQDRVLVGMASAFALAATAAASIGPAAVTLADNDRDTTEQRPVRADRVHLQLTPSSAKLAQCMPNADVDV